MRSGETERDEFIREIVSRIEAEFPGVVVVPTGAGCHDEEDDDTEVLEAYMLEKKDYERFKDFRWELEKGFAEPNGFSIMVHPLSPKVTREYRWEEYQAELRRRAERQAVAGKSEEIGRQQGKEERPHRALRGDHAGATRAHSRQPGSNGSDAKKRSSGKRSRRG